MRGAARLQGQAKAQGLLKQLFDASGEAKVSIVAQDLISQYPRADRTAIALGLESMYCQIINESNASDTQKLDMVTKANAELLKWVNEAGDTNPRAQRCADLAMRLADMNPTDPFHQEEIKHLRSVMADLGCSGDTNPRDQICATLAREEAEKYPNYIVGDKKEVEHLRSVMADLGCSSKK